MAKVLSSGKIRLLDIHAFQLYFLLTFFYDIVRPVRPFFCTLSTSYDIDQAGGNYQ